MNPLISPEELRRWSSPPDLVILDARPDRQAYLDNHLPGAIHADLERDLSTVLDPGFDPAHGGRHPLPPAVRFAQTAGRWGVGPGTPVVVYDAGDASNAAARAWWMLRALGHENVRVLDGGFAAALAEGLPVTDAEPQPHELPPYPATEWKCPTVDLAEVDRIRRDPSWKVVDVRTGERYRGETEPIDPIAGHIPGAVNLPFLENMSGGRFKTPAELRAQYQELLRGTPPAQVAVHCGSGVTACHTLLAMEAAGLRGAALFVGSWSEWCRNPALPRDPVE